MERLLNYFHVVLEYFQNIEKEERVNSVDTLVGSCVNDRS